MVRPLGAALYRYGPRRGDKRAGLQFFELAPAVDRVERVIAGSANAPRRSGEKPA